MNIVETKNLIFDDSRIILHNGLSKLYGWNGKYDLDRNKIPHELIFITYLKREVLNNPITAFEFLIFCGQFFYIEYPITMYNFSDPFRYVLSEINKMECLVEKNRCLQEKDINELKILFQFGEIATDFLIRVKGYSLVDCSSQKIILTARSNCQKYFEKYLTEGYSLQRMRKYLFVMNKYTDRAYYEEMMVLPTRDSYFEIEEIIEVAPKEYQRVVNWHSK